MCYFAKHLRLPSVFTDHSLFGFNDLPSIHLNRLLQLTLAEVNHFIAVSHTCRENFSLRANINPESKNFIIIFFLECFVENTWRNSFCKNCKVLFFSVFKN